VTTLLKLRELKYRYLAALVGQKVIIPSITQVEGPILASVSTAVKGNFDLKDSANNLTLMMWKHGFLDVTFTSSEDLLTPADKITRAVVSELGYSPRPNDPAADLAPSIKEQLGSDRGCLEVLIEDLRKQGCVLRLFLNSKWSEDALMRFVKQIAQERSDGASEESAIDLAGQTLSERMHAWFPVTFTVEDACLSNSDAIWLAKHGYL
jgi:hypothetical protein